MIEPTPGYKTSEFYLALAGPIVTLLVALGFFKGVDLSTAMGTVTGLITAVFAVIGNALVIYGYVTGRSSIKVAHMQAQAHVDASRAAAPSVNPV